MVRLVDQTIFLSNLPDAYLARKRGIEQATIDLTRRVFRYLVKAIGDIPLSEFSQRHAESFQTYIIDSGCNGVTANIYVKMARPLFRWAVTQEIIDSDPFARLRMFREPRKLVRVYETGEFASLFESCPDKLWRARVLAAKTAGLRRGEVLNLTVEDVDFTEGVIYVQPKTETRTTWRWQVKDKDVRVVPLIADLAKLLTDLLLELPEGQPYLMLTARRYKWLMQLKRGGRMPPRMQVCPDENFTKPFRRISRRAEVKRCTFHDLRRTCITEWLEGGLQPHEVMRLAGHSDVTTTMRYYVATRRSLINKAREASQTVIGATGLEPAAS